MYSSRGWVEAVCSFEFGRQSRRFHARSDEYGRPVYPVYAMLSVAYHPNDAES